MCWWASRPVYCKRWRFAQFFQLSKGPRACHPTAWCSVYFKYLNINTSVRRMCWTFQKSLKWRRSLWQGWHLRPWSANRHLIDVIGASQWKVRLQAWRCRILFDTRCLYKSRIAGQGRQTISGNTLSLGIDPVLQSLSWSIASQLYTQSRINTLIIFDTYSMQSIEKCLLRSRTYRGTRVYLPWGRQDLRFSACFCRLSHSWWGQQS